MKNKEPSVNTAFLKPSCFVVLVAVCYLYFTQATHIIWSLF